MRARGVARALVLLGAPVALAAAACTPASALPAAAGPAPLPLRIEFAAFSPARVAVLPGTAVRWDNGSQRSHDVSAEDGSFDSGLLPSGAAFTQTFTSPGEVPYFCSIHPSMTGVIDVRRLILDPPAESAVTPGDTVTFTGRSADGRQGVSLELLGPGGGPLGTAVPGADGRWSLSLAGLRTGDYRAVSGADVSETRRLLVADRQLTVAPARGRLRADVTPPDPGAGLLLEVYERERFGWWPEERARLGRSSSTTFSWPAGGLARVVLVDSDGWTPLLTSRGVLIPRQPGRSGSRRAERADRGAGPTRRR